MEKTIKFSNLEVKIVEAANEVTYTFSGDVDENFLQNQVPRIKRENIIFELADIRNFNSCGIREWIYFIKELSDFGQMSFRACSVAVIDQINLIPDSIGTGQIESLYAPYYCECQGEVSRLIDVRESHALLSRKLAPELDCDNCGKPLEFDALEESYFLFANGALPEVG
jgi:hypothetical protein